MRTLPYSTWIEDALFRHVVMFQWNSNADDSAKAAAIEALRAFGEQISELGTLSVGADAQLGQGNYDAAVVVDFASSEDYLTYANDPRHLEVVANYIKPHLGSRVAVQLELPSERP